MFETKTLFETNDLVYRVPGNPFNFSTDTPTMKCVEKVKKYKILTVYTIISLEELVNQYLSQGWDISGGVFRADDLWCQTVFRYEEV